MVARPFSSARVVTNPRGLLSMIWTRAGADRGLPSTRMRSRSVVGDSGSRRTRPFRCTRPARISSAAWAREQKPSLESARASPIFRVFAGMKKLKQKDAEDAERRIKNAKFKMQKQFVTADQRRSPPVDCELAS